MKISPLYHPFPIIIIPGQISKHLPKSAMMPPCTNTSQHYKHMTNTSAATITHTMDTSPNFTKYITNIIPQPQSQSLWQDSLYGTAKMKKPTP